MCQNPEIIFPEDFPLEKRTDSMTPLKMLNKYLLPESFII